MLDLRDRIELPAGVIVDGSGLLDSALGVHHPANATAQVVLDAPGETIGETAGRLSRSFGIPLDQARNDALAFAWELNQGLLVNIRRSRGPLRRLAGWTRLALRIAPTGSLPPTAARRRPLATATRVSAACSCGVALLARATWLSSVVAVAAAQLSVVAGDPQLVLPLAVGLATGAGLILHESGHALCLTGRPAALVTVGLRTFVLHPPLDEPTRRRVALCGPLAPVTLGVAFATLALHLHDFALAAAACPLVAHACSLIVLTSDGRAACSV